MKLFTKFLDQRCSGSSKLLNEIEFCHTYSHANGFGVVSIRNAKLSKNASQNIEYDV